MRWAPLNWARRTSVTAVSSSCSCRSSWKMAGAGKVSLWEALPWRHYVTTMSPLPCDVANGGLCFGFRVQRKVTWKRLSWERWSLIQAWSGSMKSSAQKKNQTLPVAPPLTSRNSSKNWSTFLSFLFSLFLNFYFHFASYFDVRLFSACASIPISEGQKVVVEIQSYYYLLLVTTKSYFNGSY